MQSDQKHRMRCKFSISQILTFDTMTIVRTDIPWQKIYFLLKEIYEEERYYVQKIFFVSLTCCIIFTSVAFVKIFLVLFLIFTRF